MSEIHFNLPLSPNEFASALQKGQGRALMHVRAFGLADIESAVIDACLHDRAYDPQCEGNRVGWLMDIVRASGVEARIAQMLIPQLDARDGGFWDATQRSRIARILAQKGYAEARVVLYAGLRKWPDCMDIIGMEEIVALDGTDGLLHVAGYLGKLLQEQEGTWFDDELLCQFDEVHGAGSARRILDAAGAQSPFVAGYLQHLDEQDQKKTSASTSPGGGYLRPDNVQLGTLGRQSHIERMQRITAADVIHEIESGDPKQSRYSLASWGKYASDADLLAIFKFMITQSEPGRLCKCLRALTLRALPTFDARLLSYADHDSAEVRWLAHRALSHYAQPEVRQLAMARLSAGRYLDGELRLLKMNFQPGDAAIIEQALKMPGDRDQLHAVFSDLLELFGSNRVAESARSLLWIYEESPCSNCRGDAVRILVETGMAPEWLLEECRHDSSDTIRAIVSPK